MAASKEGKEGEKGKIQQVLFLFIRHTKVCALLNWIILLFVHVLHIYTNFLVLDEKQEKENPPLSLIHLQPAFGLLLVGLNCQPLACVLVNCFLKCYFETNTDLPTNQP